MSDPFGGILNALYPAGAFEGMIDEDQLRGAQNLALRSAGARLLAGAGPRRGGEPPRPNFAESLASALDPDSWQQRLGAVAQQSSTIATMQAKAQAEAKAAQITSSPQFQPKPGETDQQRDQRLSALADALQQAGLLEHSQNVATLRTSLRSPGLTERNGKLYDHWGNLVGLAPGAEAGVDGSQLFSSAEKRLNQYEDVHGAILILNRARSAMPVQGQKLDAVTSGALVDAANAILGTHGRLSQDEENPLKALSNAKSAGDLGKFLSALLSGGSGQLTVSQRNEILRLVDNVIDDLDADQERVKKDIRRRFESRWKDQPVMLQRMLEQLPDVPRLLSRGRTSSGVEGVSQSRIDQMRADAGVPR